MDDHGYCFCLVVTGILYGEASQTRYIIYILYIYTHIVYAICWNTNVSVLPTFYDYMLLGGGTSFADQSFRSQPQNNQQIPGVGWFRDQSWSKSMVNFWGVPSDSTLQGPYLTWPGPNISFSWRKWKNHRLKSAFFGGAYVSSLEGSALFWVGNVMTPVICIYLWPFESLRCQGLSRGGTCTCGLRKGLVSGCHLWGGNVGVSSGVIRKHWFLELFLFCIGKVVCVSVLFVQEVTEVMKSNCLLLFGSFVVA